MGFDDDDEEGPKSRLEGRKAGRGAGRETSSGLRTPKGLSAVRDDRAPLPPLVLVRLEAAAAEEEDEEEEEPSARETTTAAAAAVGGADAVVEDEGDGARDELETGEDDVDDDEPTGKGVLLEWLLLPAREP